MIAVLLDVLRLAQTSTPHLRAPAWQTLIVQRLDDGAIRVLTLDVEPWIGILAPDEVAEAARRLDFAELLRAQDRTTTTRFAWAAASAPAGAA